MHYVTPDVVGLEADRLQNAAGLIQTSVDKGEIGAASLTVCRNGSIAFAEGFGKERPGSGAKTTVDSVFLLASISKPISVCGLMMLVEQGRASLNDRVQDHLPDFKGEQKGEVLVRHLLSHTSGMPDMLPENMALRQDHTPMHGFVAGALKTPLLFKPGTDFRYQSKGILLAAEIVERSIGKTFRDFLHSEIFEPLGMEQSSLGLGGRTIDKTVWCGVRDDTQSRSDWGPNSPYWRDAGHPWGGIHSSGPDIARILQVFLSDGERLFSPGTARGMIRDQNVHLKAPWGLGWGLRDSRVWTYFGDLCSPRTFGHVGSTGTVAWGDPDTGTSCVILTNEMVGDGRLLRRVSNVVASSVRT